MGLREEINKKPGITSGVVGGLIVLLLIFIGWRLMGSRSATHPSMKLFYTSDDGHTWFADDYDKITPFDHDGATAVLCHVFKCSNSAPFAGYLETYSQALHDQKLGLTQIDSAHPRALLYLNVLCKRPGDKNWVLVSSGPGGKVRDVHCPDGSAERPQAVFP